MSSENNVYVWRQAFVLSAGFIHSMGTSFMLSFPSVLNSEILSPNSTGIRATPDQASWIAASTGITGTIGFIVHSFIMQKFGRKIDFIILNASVILGWTISLFSNSVSSLIVARAVQGLSAGGLFIGSLIISEFSHPTRRGYFSAIKRCSGGIGNLICHSLILSCTWRTVAAIAMIPATVSLIITLFWPETPSFLALKGRFEDCEKSFVWLNGNSAQSQRELQDLILAQKERKDNKTKKTLCGQIKDKTFLRTFLIVSLLTLVVDACGKYYFIAYITQIMTDIIGDKSIAVYCTMGGDILSIVALSISVFVIRKYNRRSLLLGVGGFSVLLMFSVGLVTMLKSSSTFWLVPSIILLHYFMVNISIIPVCFTLFGELFPLESRGIGCCLSGIVLTCFYVVIMKLTPILMKNTGIQGTYMTYGLCILICFSILYFILPETKDKTLQEIENELRKHKRDTIETKPMLSGSKQV